ncbi:replication-relaxation family protein [Nocardia sp. NPDC059195]|uniref:replication-relaxation family protein n=1 Tax=Nocardia sp. NPDC059195 TaxID=3346765 RepID=UPI0036BF3BAD
MITRPTRQADLRASRPRRVPAADHTGLAVRLTGRDRWILRMLHEHRVLTTTQLADLAFPTLKIGRRRLALLHSYRVVDRFQPLRTRGSAPGHWVLAPAGAAVLAAEAGIELRELRYRREQALAIAHSLQLAHTVGVNEWFTALATAKGGGGQLQAWWSEARCRRLWGDLVRPDAYGRHTHTGTALDFFLEYDLGTITLSTVANKLTGYAELARSTGIVTPVLLWVPTAARESNARRAVAETWSALPDPAAVPVATAAAELLDPGLAHPSPADRVWLPLDSTDIAERVALHQLPDMWPHVTPPPPSSDQTSPSMSGAATILAPPTPTPPREHGGL